MPKNSALKSSRLITKGLSLSFKDPLGFAFVLPLIYWIYLLFSSSMEIKFDAAGYERLATVLYKQGWIEFFKIEPEKGFLYPFLISLSMRIADFFSVSYQSIQTFFQILLLLTTQLLIFKILKKLSLNKILIALAILYLGISPSMVNSAFSLYCEVLTYPFILGIIFIGIQSWKSIQARRYFHIFLTGLSFAVVFFCLTSIRAIFEYIGFIFLFSYVGLAFGFLMRKQKSYFVPIMVLVVVSFFSFSLLVTSYQSMNFKYNGHKVLVVSGASALYANTVGRTRDLTTNNFLSALAQVPGEGICLELLGTKECSFWWDENEHILGINKFNELKAHGVPNDQIESTLIKLSVERIFQKPFQYTLLTIMEGVKMLFWESTKIGYVIYPPWLQRLFDFTLFKNGLRLLIFLVTFVSLLYLMRYVWQSRRRLFDAQQAHHQDILILFFVLVMILANVFLHSFFKIATRYAFPIVPLYFIAITFFLQKLIFKKS